jgi:hypothetical protein
MKTEEQKKLSKAIKDSISDKNYIKQQAQKGLSIDHSKLKAGKIARISL